jgi:hypothetical protein
MLCASVQDEVMDARYGSVGLFELARQPIVALSARQHLRL